MDGFRSRATKTGEISAIRFTYDYQEDAKGTHTHAIRCNGVGEKVCEVEPEVERKRSKRIKMKNRQWERRNAATAVYSAGASSYVGAAGRLYMYVCNVYIYTAMKEDHQGPVQKKSWTKEDELSLDSSPEAVEMSMSMQHSSSSLSLSLSSSLQFKYNSQRGLFSRTLYKSTLKKPTSFRRLCQEQWPSIYCP